MKIYKIISKMLINFSFISFVVLTGVNLVPIIAKNSDKNSLTPGIYTISLLVISTYLVVKLIKDLVEGIIELENLEKKEEKK